MYCGTTKDASENSKFRGIYKWQKNTIKGVQFFL